MSTSTKTMKTIKYLGLFFWNVLPARGDQSDQNCRNLWDRTYGPEEIQTKRPCFLQPFSLLLSYNHGHWDRTDLVPSPSPLSPQISVENECLMHFNIINIDLGEKGLVSLIYVHERTGPNEHN